MHGHKNIPSANPLYFLALLWAHPILHISKIRVNQRTGASAATCTSFLFYVAEVPPPWVKLLLYKQLYTYWSDDTKVPPWTGVIQNNLCKSQQIKTNNRITPKQSSNNDAWTSSVILADNTIHWINHNFFTNRETVSKMSLRRFTYQTSDIGPVQKCTKYISFECSTLLSRGRDSVIRGPRADANNTGWPFPHVRWTMIRTHQLSVSQPPGRSPVPGPGINYTGPREVLLEFVILVF